MLIIYAFLYINSWKFNENDIGINHTFTFHTIITLYATIVRSLTCIKKGGSSLRITIPKKVQSKLHIKEEDILGFYEEDGRIILMKLD